MHHCRRRVSYKARITNGENQGGEEGVPLSRGVLFHFRAHQSFALTGPRSGAKTRLNSACHRPPGLLSNPHRDSRWPPELSRPTDPRMQTTGD